MRTFALVAFLAAYASAVKQEIEYDATDNVDETANVPESKFNIGDVLGGGITIQDGTEGEAISDALENAAEEVDGGVAVDAGAELAGGDDEAIAEGITDEALAESIDGALAQANENGR